MSKIYEYLVDWFRKTDVSIHPIDRAENKVLGDILERIDMVSLVEWKTPDEKPEIPEGRYGVSVLIITYDSTYDELSPGNGWDVHNGVYGSTRGRDGVKRGMYYNSDREFDFMELYVGKYYGEYGPVCDEIKYWAYVPKMVNGKLVR
jgi:hypothetical protein